MQNFLNLGKTFFQISDMNIAQTWFLARSFAYLSFFYFLDSGLSVLNGSQLNFWLRNTENREYWSGSMSESQQGPEICDVISVMRYLVYLQNIYLANFKRIYFKEKSNFFNQELLARLSPINLVIHRFSLRPEVAWKRGLRGI